MEDLAGKHTGSYKPALIWGMKQTTVRGGPWDQAVAVTEQPAQGRELFANDS